jgi:esterase
MKLFFRKYGKGPALIILHGLYGSSDNWTTIARKLSDTFTVYLPDQRNHGQSPHSNIHNYDSMRDDLFELVNDLSIGKFFLAGHSMGGKTAISFSLKWPEMINGLLIADISPFVDENLKLTAYNRHKSILNAMLSLDLSSITTRREAEKILEGSIHSDKVRGFILKNLRRTTDDTFTWKINCSALLTNLEKIMEGIDRKAYMTESITGFPIIFLKGAESDYIPTNDFSDILKVYPGAEFITVQNAGHWIHSERPDEVIRSVKKLLGD